MLRWVSVLAALGSMWAVPAHAQAPLEESLRRYAEADFRGALAALDEAERGDSLSREDLLRAIELRSNLSFALGDEAEARRALGALAAIAPEHALSEDSPPELHAMLRDARSGGEGLRVRLAVSALEGGGARLRASVEGAPEGMVRRVSIVHRESDGEWAHAPETLALDSASPRVEYYAIAIGPGGAILAQAGSEGAPRVWRGGAVASVGDDGLAIGLGVAGGVAALAVIIAIAVVASSGGSNTIGAPAVTW